MKTKTQLTNRILSLVLTLVMVLGMLPMTSFTALAADTTTEKNIVLGASHIEGAQASNVYFGTYKQSSDGNGGYNIDPIKWRVLSNADGKLFLLSDQNLDVFQYHTEKESVTWETSTMRSWLNRLANNKGAGDNAIDYADNNFLDTAFSASEQTAIADTTVANESQNNTTDKVFLLSSEEAKNTAYGFTNDDSRQATNTAYVAGGGEISTRSMYGVGVTDNWWLRSEGGLSSDKAVIIGKLGPVVPIGNDVNDRDVAVRPALNINLSSILFTSAAEGGKPQGFNAVEQASGNDWKLTLLDSSRSFAVSDTTAKTVQAGDTLSLGYTGATTGTNEYISAMFVDANGEVVYYGQFAQPTAANGTVDFVVPSDVEGGTYTLKLFNEQLNGDYKTDYSSDFVDIALTIIPTATVSFIANGGTGSMDSVYVIDGAEYTLPGCTFTAPSGAQFKGWATSANGEVITTETITVTADTTLYAIWENIAAEAPSVQVSENLTLTYGEFTNQKITATVEEKDGYSYEYQWIDINNEVINRTNELLVPDDLVVGEYSYYLAVGATRNDNGDVAWYNNSNILVKVNAKELNNNSADVILSDSVFTYSGEEQKPGVTVTYNDKPLTKDTDYTLDWSADCKNVGSKTVTVNFKGNYSGSTQKTFEIKKAPLTVTAGNKTITYGEPAANNGVTYSGFVPNESADVLGGTLVYNYTYSQYGNAGDYDITVSGLTSDNYDIIYQKGTLTVEKADATYTAPKVNDLTYNGDRLELVIEGTVNGGHMEYSLNGDDWSTAIPTATEADTYKVYYKVIGDDNHNGTAPAYVTVEIKKATPDLGTVSADGTVYDTTAPNAVVLTQTGTVEGTFVITDPAMLANKSVYNYTFTPNDTKNYNSVNGQVTIDVQDTVLPTVSISVDDHKWTFWDTVTFGLFYNESKEVTITYADNENGSGLKDMLYFVADYEYEIDELLYAEWKSYTEAFDIDPDGKYVVYAKAVDNDGNSLIINSNGIVLDKTQAAVEGITNGGIYYGQLEFTVADELAGVKSVVIDFNDKTHFEGQYVIIGDNAEHTVVVTDNAGNVTEYKVTVYKNYTVTYAAGDETVAEITVGHGGNAASPKVPTIDGYVGKWDNDGKNITGDTTISAIYTEIPAIKTDEVKLEDKTDLEDTKKQFEDMLNDDSYTDDDKKVIQDAIDDIDDALEVIANVEAVEELIDKLPDTIKKDDEAAIKAADDAYNALTDYERSLVDDDAKNALEDAKAALNELNKPGDSGSPATGDNSNVWLWIAILFISGGAVITLTVVDKKRRFAANK